MNEKCFVSENLIFKFLQGTGLLYALVILSIMILDYFYPSKFSVYNSMLINILVFCLGGTFEILLWLIVVFRKNNNPKDG